MSVLKAIGSNTFDREAAYNFDQADNLNVVLSFISFQGLIP